MSRRLSTSESVAEGQPAGHFGRELPEFPRERTGPAATPAEVATG